MIELAPTYREIGERSKRAGAARLRAGQGVRKNGAVFALPPKREPDGRPVGGDLPKVIEQGVVTVQADGCTISWPSKALETFHAGRPRQRGRRVIGLSKAERAEYGSLVGDALAARLRRIGIAR